MFNVQRGSIWYTKSVNECEYFYEGMTYGRSKILVMSIYQNQGRTTYTYLKLNRKESKNTYPIKINGFTKYVDLSKLYTGDIRSLDDYVTTLNYSIVKEIIRQIGILMQQRNIKNSNQQQQCIKKFGINVYVTENENVSLRADGKILLSNKAKEDIIYNSKTDEDIRILCDKYNIFPIKAIKEIRNRLIYQHKQKEG